MVVTKLSITILIKLLIINYQIPLINHMSKVLQYFVISNFIINVLQSNYNSIPITISNSITIVITNSITISNSIKFKLS